MKLTNLPKDFVYTDRKSIEDFLSENDLNKDLYKVYIRVDHTFYKFDFAPEKAFNEAYYIATLAMNEPHPEVLLNEWWNLAKIHMGKAYAANLVMSMVYVILSLQENKPPIFEYVLHFSVYHNYGKDYLPFFKQLADNSKVRFNSNLKIHPLPVSELKKYSEDLQQLTDNFTQKNIKELVSIYPNTNWQLDLLKLIEAEQKRVEKQESMERVEYSAQINKEFYDDLRIKIKNEQVKPAFCFMAISKTNSPQGHRQGKSGSEHSVKDNQKEIISEKQLSVEGLLSRVEILEERINELINENAELAQKSLPVEIKTEGGSVTNKIEKISEKFDILRDNQTQNMYISIEDIAKWSFSCNENCVSTYKQMIYDLNISLPDELRKKIDRYEQEYKAQLSRPKVMNLNNSVFNDIHNNGTVNS